MFIFRHKACYLDSAIYAPTNKILVGLIELLDSLSVGILPYPRFNKVLHADIRALSFSLLIAISKSISTISPEASITFSESSRLFLRLFLLTEPFGLPEL